MALIGVEARRRTTAANIQRYLGTIRARRRWEARFALALAPDSNLNTVSRARTIRLDTPSGRLPFTRSGDIAPKSGLGLSVRGGGAPIQGPPLRPAFRPGLSRPAPARRFEGRGQPARHPAAAMERRPTRPSARGSKKARGRCRAGKTKIVRNCPGCLIPAVIVQNPWAHFRVPMDAIRAGCETRLFEAWQQ